MLILKKKCTLFLFTCLIVVCLLPSSDRTADCADGSDEGEHCKVRECDEMMYRCPESGRCIPKSWLCDFDRDCSFGEDETNCSSYKMCADNMFECGSHECIENQYFCDGTPGKNAVQFLLSYFGPLPILND